ncbi:MAG: hypothetical protein IME93_03180 [Proteobacteria bacterium]|nr:hypothetical protein [Pseudomonadota bacterium]
MDGRQDFAKYNAACKTLLNTRVMPQGGAVRRAGTYFVGEVKDSSKSTRIIPFEFSNTQAYIIEVGEFYMRFYKDGGRILESAKTITGITAANPPVVSSTAHGYSNGDWVYIGSVVGMTEINGKYYVVANKNANDYELTDVDGNNIDASAYTAYTSGGTSEKVYEIATTIPESNLFTLNFTQSHDVLYITHVGHHPQTLTRSGHSSWALASHTITADPFTSKVITGITQANPAVVTSTAHGHTDGQIVYLDEVVGMTEVNGKPYVVTNQAANTFELYDSDGNTVDSSAYTAYSSAGVISNKNPAAVTIYEQRLVYAGTTLKPQTIYGSKSADYNDFTTGTNDDDAYVYTMGSNQVNVIYWLAAGKKLLIGTSSKGFSMNGGLDEGITPTNVKVTPEDAPGALQLPPVVSGNKAIYVQRSGKKIREMAYRFEIEGYAAPDMNILSDHIFSDSPVVDMDFQEEPDSVIWCVRGDGVLAGLTYKREEEVVAWHRHTTDGNFESVASIPTATEDQTWLIANRTINSIQRRYIEYFGDTEWEDATMMADTQLHTDCALTYSGSDVSSLSGLDHLEGKTVDVVVDGAVHPQLVVTNGAITLTIAGGEIEVGLHYESEVTPMRPEIEAFGNTQQGKAKRWNKVTVRLLNSLGLEINGDQLPFRKTSDNMDTAVPVFTGDKQVSNSGFDTDGYVTIKQTQPLPMTILLITGEIGVSSR